MSKTDSIPVYVDNISDEVEINDLRQLFRRYGPIDVVTIMGRDGFVNFISVKDALDAIKNLVRTFFDLKINSITIKTI